MQGDKSAVDGTIIDVLPPHLSGSSVRFARQPPLESTLNIKAEGA